MYDFMKKKYWLIMNMTSAACLKTVSRGQEKAGKVSGTKKKQLGKLLITKSISERQSFTNLQKAAPTNCGAVSE